MKSARTALDREQKQHEETKKELAGRKDSLSELMVENGSLKVDLGSLQSEHAILKVEHADVKQQHEAMYCVSPQQYNQLAQEKADAEKASQEAQAALQQALAEKTVVTNAFDKLKDMNTNIISATRTYKTDAAAMATQIAKLTSQLAQQTAEHEAELKATRDVLSESVESTKKAALEAQRNLKTLVGSLETDLARERKMVAALTKEAKTNAVRAPANAQSVAISPPKYSTFNTNTSPSAARADHRDDFSVLSDGTYPVNTTAVQLAPPFVKQLQSTASRGKPRSKATRLLIHGVSPDTPPHRIQSLAEKYGPLVDFERINQSNYLVEYKDLDDASLALYHIPSRSMDGMKLYCKVYVEPPINPVLDTVTTDSVASVDTQYFPVPYATTTTANTATFVLDKTASDALEKKHLRCVYVLHLAPAKLRLPESDTKRMCSRYGDVKQIRPVADSGAYCVEYFEKQCADDALTNFPPEWNGYQVSCKCHFNQLPKTLDPVLASDGDRSQEYPNKITSTNRATHRVILHDPLLTENRPVNRPDNHRGPYCSSCDREGRVNVMYSHNDERCFYRRNMHQGSAGGNHHTNNHTNHTKNSYTKNSGDRSQVNLGYEKKRGRSESPERPSQKSSSSGKERDASSDGRSTGSGGGSGRGGGSVGGSGGGSGVKSNKPSNDTFDPVTGVRPLSTSR